MMMSNQTMSEHNAGEPLESMRARAVAREAVFPIGDTLGGGAIQVVEYLLGRGPQALYLGQLAGAPERGPGQASASSDRCLVSVIWAPRGVPLEMLREQLGYRLVVAPELLHLGPFDTRGEDKERRSLQREFCALVERMPAGEWLPRLLPVAGVPARPVLGPVAAVELGLSIGRLLEEAAREGQLLVGVRPEYVWARRREGKLTAVAVTGRNWEFFAHTGGGCMLPGRLHERHYYAPEVYEGRGGGEAALVFTLAIMIAEWAGGAFPFPDSWAGGDMSSQCAGRHAPLELPSPLARLLEQCFKREPAQRPPLGAVLDRLGALAGALRR